MTFFKLLTLIHISFKRTWLSLLICFSIWFLAFTYGTTNKPLNFNFTDFTILDHQIRRSNNLRNVDVLITGDSSGLSAIDPVHLEKQFNKKFQVLSTMGVVGPLGHIKLIDNYLKNNPRLETLAIIWAPPTFHSATPWEKHVFQGIWSLRNNFQLGRAVLREKVFGGILNPPLEGDLRQYYVNSTNLINSMSKQHGTVHFSGRMDNTFKPDLNKPYTFPMSNYIEAKLRKVKVMLKELSIDKIFIAIIPHPDVYFHPTLEASRKRLIFKLQKLLELQKESFLKMPLILPSKLYSGKTHFNEEGRAAFTQIFRKSLLNTLCKSNIKNSKECANDL